MQLIKFTESFGESADSGRVGDKDAKGGKMGKENREDSKRI